jgi:nucleolar protein 16
MRKDQLTISYAALGLLPSIPLPTGASSSTTHRAPINLPSSSSSSGLNSEGGNEEVTPKVSYGRIIRDDQGNVIDIILDEEEDQGAKDGGEEVEGALNPAKEWVPEKVEAKTDVVRCKSFFPSSSAQT